MLLTSTVSVFPIHMKRMLFGRRNPVDSLLHHHIRSCCELKERYESGMTGALHPRLKGGGQGHAPIEVYGMCSFW